MSSFSANIPRPVRCCLSWAVSSGTAKGPAWGHAGSKILVCIAAGFNICANPASAQACQSQSVIARVHTLFVTPQRVVAKADTFDQKPVEKSWWRCVALVSFPDCLHQHPLSLLQDSWLVMSGGQGKGRPFHLFHQRERCRTCWGTYLGLSHCRLASLGDAKLAITAPLLMSGISRTIWDLHCVCPDAPQLLPLQQGRSILRLQAPDGYHLEVKLAW